MKCTLLMIHGMFCTGAVWSGFASLFESRGHTCLKPTLRFHDMPPDGRPDPRLGTVSLTDYMEDLGRVADALYEAPVIVGHSMGGLLAQMLAARGIGRALVLLNPAPPAGVWSVVNRRTLSAFGSYQRRWAFWRKPHRLTFREASRSVFGMVPPDRHRELYETLVFESGRAIFEIGAWFLDGRKTTRVEASSIRVPTLVVGCSRDRMVPAFISRKVAAAYEGRATYREFENHGHWIIGEPGWEDIADYVLNWIESLGQAPGSARTRA